MSNNALRSTNTYATAFTFFVETKETSDGTVVISSTSHKTPRWWNEMVEWCTWVDENITVNERFASLLLCISRLNVEGQTLLFHRITAQCIVFATLHKKNCLKNT